MGLKKRRGDERKTGNKNKCMVSKHDSLRNKKPGVEHGFLILKHCLKLCYSKRITPRGRPVAGKECDES